MRALICMTHYCPWSDSTAASLQAMGHEVHVFDFARPGNDGYLDPGNPQIAADARVYRKNVSEVHLVPARAPGHMRHILGAVSLRRVARRIEADVVLTLYGGGFGLMAYLSGFRPYAVYVVGSDVLMAGRLLRTVNRSVLSSASRVFANGEYLAGKAAEQAPRAKILPLLIGVDLPSLKRSNFPPGPTRFICTRGFLDVYNNAAIIRAIARFPHDCPDFRMVFVSGGPLLEQHIELADQVLPPRLRERVEFWGGVSYQRLLDALAESHLFLSMSRSDGTATSILEAMGTGLFPILSDIPQNHALIGPEDRNGVLVPLDDPDRLASAMLWAMGNVDACARCSDRNREVIEQKADAARNRRILAEQLEALVATDRGDKK